jgi:CRISPR-associated protein Cas2
MSLRKTYLICYDVRDPARLRRVHRVVRDFAAPVQFSVFEAELKPAELENLLQSLTELIDLDQDRIGIYPLSNGQQKISLGYAGTDPVWMQI